MDDCEYRLTVYSTEDILEENAFLRAERASLFAQLTTALSTNGNSHLQEQLLTLKAANDKTIKQNGKLNTEIVSLKYELDVMRRHSTVLFEDSKILESRLFQTEETVNSLNAEILQILPLRIKVNKSRQKTDSLSVELLHTSNQLSDCIRLTEVDKIRIYDQKLLIDDLTVRLESLSKELIATTAEKKGGRYWNMCFYYHFYWFCM